MKSSDNREIVEGCFLRLIQELGEVAGGRAVKIIIEELGGFNIHVPSMKTLEVEARDAAIRRAWKEGCSREAIAETFGLPPRRVYRIIHRPSDKGRKT